MRRKSVVEHTAPARPIIAPASHLPVYSAPSTWSPREPQPLPAITAVQHALPPHAIVQIPHHCLAQPRFEALLRPPAELALELARVDGVTRAGAGPVGDDCDELRMRPVRRLRQQ